MKNFPMVSLNIHIWLIEYTYMCTVEASGSVGYTDEVALGSSDRRTKRGTELGACRQPDWDSNAQCIQFSTALF